MQHRFAVMFIALLSLRPLYLDRQPGVFPDSALGQLLGCSTSQNPEALVKKSVYFARASLATLQAALFEGSV